MATGSQGREPGIKVQKATAHIITFLGYYANLRFCLRDFQLTRLEFALPG